MKISRRVYNEATGGYRQDDKVLTINVKKGWKAGTKVTFAKEGDQVPGKVCVWPFGLLDYGSATLRCKI